MEIFTESQFSACYIHYRRRVRGYILSRVSDREEAEDLTQDVFENIWRCREGVRKETLHNLVYTVMRNTVIDYLRRRYMKKDRMDIYTCCEEEEGRNTVEEDYYYKELRVAHRKMVKQLSEKRRQAYLLYFYRGMSYASIADRLSVSERTVGGHLVSVFRTVRLGVDGIYRYKAG